MIAPLSMSEQLDAFNPRSKYDELSLAIQAAELNAGLEELEKEINGAYNNRLIDQDQLKQLRDMTSKRRLEFLESEVTLISTSSDQQELTKISVAIHEKFRAGGFTQSEFNVLSGMIERKTDKLIEEVLERMKNVPLI